MTHAVNKAGTGAQLIDLTSIEPSLHDLQLKLDSGTANLAAYLFDVNGRVIPHTVDTTNPFTLALTTSWQTIPELLGAKWSEIRDNGRRTIGDIAAGLIILEGDNSHSGTVYGRAGQGLAAAGGNVFSWASGTAVRLGRLPAQLRPGSSSVLAGGTIQVQEDTSWAAPWDAIHLVFTATDADPAAQDVMPAGDPTGTNDYHVTGVHAYLTNSADVVRVELKAGSTVLWSTYLEGGVIEGAVVNFPQGSPKTAPDTNAISVVVTRWDKATGAAAVTGDVLGVVVDVFGYSEAL